MNAAHDSSYDGEIERSETELDVQETIDASGHLSKNLKDPSLHLPLKQSRTYQCCFS